MVELVAVSCYDAKVEEELSLQTGDIIKNSTFTDREGWWEGELNGKRGRFPRIFVEEVPSHPVTEGKPVQPRSLRRKPGVRKKQRLCEVVISYNPVRQEHLELSVGDIIEVLDEVESGWWLGKKNGKTGCFPSNFVLEMNHIEGSRAKNQDGPSSELQVNLPPNSETMMTRGTGVGLEEPTLRSANPQADDGCRGEAGQKIAKEYYEAAFDYVASNEDELSLHKGDVVLVLEKDTGEDGWWEGYVNGNQGLFPDNYVVPYVSTKAVKKELPPRDVTEADISKEYYEAVSDYVARTEDELSLHKGDVVLVLEKGTAEDGWWEGCVNGNQGLFPDSHVVPYVGTKEVKKELPPRDEMDADISFKHSPMATVKNPELYLWKSDHKDEKKEPKNEWSESAVKPNLMPPKKVPPPVKVKPLLTNLPNKVGGEQAPAPQELIKPARDRTNDSESVTFDALAPPAETLKHLTANRPRAQGRRPPTHHRGPAAHNAKLSVSPPVPAKVKPPTIQLSEPPPSQRHQSAAGRAGPVLPSSPNKTQREAEREDRVDSIAGLKVELQRLQLSFDLLKNQHLRDTIDLKEEIAEERIKWNALQMEVENLRKIITSQQEH
ncbi:SH3 domain-containing protein 21 isoform X5 [Pristis pectinata]|uniref:SH3 domain-containing protein 21 isoform X2 n=1 Tax=Pristis pectinata TaxID=685728 RepID=UPI00223E5DDF|nr:SH3 domain-containing protein 21 isoform X2 [Pristis pectinata]XP_051892553.1 SH3 domain-containing protein 21 isoform X3 [Pristis pectinata]XP_051892554.1 SH3 domain-containing protein 21 isoform X4 [Pristis pectinata]XP_051892555.1 SH3 domain-containing protein 21 isoform X5 [Pristis pectinata]